jgi:hypothetical protein
MRLVLPPLLVACALLLGGCPRAPNPSSFRVTRTRCEPCRIEALATQLAGSAAEDCGWARQEHERAGVQACAWRALEAGRPFRALVTGQGIDSIIVHAFVRTPTGALAQLTSDSDPGGGLRACHALVTRTPCARLLAPPQGRGLLSCEGPGPLERLCDEQTRSTRESSDGEDARGLACNPLPTGGDASFCLRLPSPGGNVPPGLELTCEPFSSEAPDYLVCHRQEAGVRRSH